MFKKDTNSVPYFFYLFLFLLFWYNNLDMIYTFGRTPSWASSLPDYKTPYGYGDCAYPTNISYQF
jgi:hypothetical protein